MKNVDVAVYLLSGLWFFLGCLLMRRARRIREKANARIEEFKAIADRAIATAQTAVKQSQVAAASMKSMRDTYLDSPDYLQYLFDNKLRASVGLSIILPGDALKNINDIRRNRGLSIYASLKDLPACYSELLK